MATTLAKILNDANILDNSRFTINTPLVNKTHINENLLQYNFSKSLIETSFVLENLTQNVPANYILNYQNKNSKEHYYNKNSYRDSLVVDNSKLPIIKNVPEKQDIQLDKR